MFPAGITLRTDVVIRSATPQGACLTGLSARNLARASKFAHGWYYYNEAKRPNPHSYLPLILNNFRYEIYCADHYGNSICDPSCNTEACGWDGLDCAADTPAKIVPGTLLIWVQLQPKELLGDLRGFLRSLGALLHTNLQVKLDQNKKPMVYPYFRVEEDHGHQLRGSRSKRELEKEVIG